MNIKINSKQLLLFNFFDIDQFSDLFWWNPGKKIIKLQFGVTLSNISQIFWPISISRMSSGLFLSSEEKNPRGPEKRYGALNVSCSEVCPQFSVDLRFFCLRGPICICLPASNESFRKEIGQKLTEWEQKQKLVIFWKKFGQILEGSKKAGFWPKTPLFLIFLGIPQLVTLLFG